MLKTLLLPLMLAAFLAACSKEEPASAPPAKQEATAPATAAAPSGETRVAAGEDTYKKTCALCHDTGAGGAPLLTHADWDARIAAGKDTLYKHALEGFTGDTGMMPPRGGNSALSDAAVKSAVDYMLSQLK